MNDRAMEALLEELFNCVSMGINEFEPIHLPNEQYLLNSRVETYVQAGVLTTDRGLEITTKDGQCFQITIIQKR